MWSQSTYYNLLDTETSFYTRDNLELLVFTISGPFVQLLVGELASGTEAIEEVNMVIWHNTK